MVSNLILPANSSFTSERRPDLLNGVTILKSEAMAVTIDSNGSTLSTKAQPFTAIPCYAWAHRGKGEMMVWMPEKVTGIEILSR